MAVQWENALQQFIFKQGIMCRETASRKPNRRWAIDRIPGFLGFFNPANESLIWFQRQKFIK